MSKKSIHTIVCKHCSHEFKKEVNDSYNTLLDENVVKKILECNDFIFECPNCKKETYHDHSLVYNDMLNNIMVQYVCNLNEAYDVIKQYEKLNNKYKLDHKLRVVVRDQPRFMEKVAILAHGYNDLVMEFYKSVFSAKLNVGENDEVFITFSLDEEEIMVSIYHENGEESNYVFNKEMYDYLYNVLKTKEYFNRTNDYFVDDYFVSQLLEDESDCEPLHIEVFRHREYVAEVYIEELNKTTQCLVNENLQDEAVKVIIDSKIYDGKIKFIRLLSEHRLGKSFESLTKIVDN